MIAAALVLVLAAPSDAWAHCREGGSVYFVPQGEPCRPLPARDRVRAAALDIGDPLSPALVFAVRKAIEDLASDNDQREHLGEARISRLRDGGVVAISAIAPDWSNSQGPDTYRVAFDSAGDVVLMIDPRSGRYEWSVVVE